jgi:cyclase
MRTRPRLLICATVVAVSCGCGLERAAELPFVITPVTADIWEAAPNPKSKTLIPTNIGIVAGDDGVLVIDTLASVDAAGNFSNAPSEQILTEIRRITRKPVRFVVNTHHHLDHVGGNTVFAQAGATVVGDHRLRDWLQSENLRSFGPSITASQKTFIERLAPPTLTYDHGIDLFLGRREVHVRSFAGHSGSDSVVVVPDAKVVFTGDLLWPDTLPTLVDASTGVWIETLDALATSEPDATFIPGHGDIAKARNVMAFREYLASLKQLVTDAQRGGKSAEEVVAAVMPTLTDKYGQWQLFAAVAKQNILDVDGELRGTKRVPR